MHGADFHGEERMKSLRLGKLALAFASSTLALSCPTAGWAQASAASAAEQQGGLGEIVVTATKRETFLQDQPLAVSAIGGAAIDSRGIHDHPKLSVAPPSQGMRADRTEERRVGKKGGSKGRA